MRRELKELIEQYDNINQQMKALDHKLKKLKPPLIDALIDNDNELETEQVLVKLSEYTRESFKLKDAKKQIDNRVLKPFITESTTKRITLKKVG